jgi:hypothetical protein
VAKKKRVKPAGTSGNKIPEWGDTPLHVAARAQVNQAMPDECKTSQPVSNANPTPDLGNPVDGYPSTDRQETSRALAWGHPDLRQSNTDFSRVLSRLSTVRGNVMDLGVSPDTAGGFSHAGEVALHHFDAADQAGRFHGRLLGKPVADPMRPDYHQAPSGSGSNGTHDSASQQGACSPLPYSSKSSRLDVMRETQRRLA